MAKKPVTKTTKTTVETTTVPPESEDTLGLETGEEGVLRADPLQELLGLGDDIRWYVYKVSGKPGDKGGYCDTYTGESLSVEVLRDTWGGGRFRIRGHSQDGKFAGQSTIDVLEPIKPAAPLAGPAAPSLKELAEILATRSGDQGTAAAMAALTAMINSQATQIAALMNRPAQPQTSLVDILALIKATREEGGGVKGAIDTLLQGFNLARDLGGGGGTDELSVAKSGIDLVAKLIAENKAGKPAEKPASPKPGPALAAQPPATPAPGNGAAEPTPEADPMLQKLHWLKTQVDLLVYQANRESDPELYASVMMDNLPPYITEQEIQQRMVAPDALQQLAQIDARVTKFAPWFEEFRQAVLAILAEEEPPATPQAQPTDVPLSDDDNLA
jgi:hypothetical protein